MQNNELHKISKKNLEQKKKMEKSKTYAKNYSGNIMSTRIYVIVFPFFSPSCGIERFEKPKTYGK